VAKLRKKSKDTILVISGRIEEGIDIPEGVIYVGYIEDEEIPVLINCFDCAVVMNKNSKFGNYSYPIKLYEAMACEIPLVVSKTESTAWIMKEYESVLVEPGDIEELSAAINKSISLGRVQYGPTVSWQDNAKKIEAVLLSKSI
jgi:glycosyltransferase involved in cell wall biosynthesis